MIRTCLVLFAVAALAACSAPDPKSRGEMIYDQHCTACHGTGAKGDGPLAQDLGVRPADLTLISARNDGVFPTDEVMAQIFGYHGRYQIGGMPEFGPVLDGPMVDYETISGEIIPTPQALIDLTQYLQSIQQ